MLSDSFGEFYSGVDGLRATYIDPVFKDGTFLVPATVVSLGCLVLFIDYARMLWLWSKMVSLTRGLITWMSSLTNFFNYSHQAHSRCR